MNGRSRTRAMRFVQGIRRLISALIVVAITGCPAAAQSPSRHLTAIVTPSNDLSVEESPLGRRAPVPSVVEAKIRAIVADQRQKWRASLRESAHSWDFYGTVFRINAPEARELYVFNFVAPLGFQTYYLLLFDRHKATVTERPPVVYAKWTKLIHGLLVRPLIAFEDVDRDGYPELVVQEHVHNGTMYNGVVYHYFHVGPSLSLRRILAVETRVVDIHSLNEQGRIVRTVTANSPAELLLETWTQRSASAPREKVGEAILRRSRIGTPFRVAARRAIDAQ